MNHRDHREHRGETSARLRMDGEFKRSHEEHKGKNTKSTKVGGGGNAKSTRKSTGRQSCNPKKCNHDNTKE
jgi:hypothetical protein